jgi:cyclohexanecarboxyl-CoA dehydrogenase
MDYSLDQEQQLILSTVHEFSENVLLPKYTYWDRHDEFPREVWTKMGELGLFGMRVSAENGGLDLDCLTAGMVMEELARGDFNVCYGILNSCLAGDVLGKYADKKIQSEWLPAMSNGSKILSICLTEPHCGSDAAAIKTRAVRRGDDYVLSGEKSAITLLMVADAVIVFARTGGPGAKGISAFFVPLDLPGISRYPYSDMGARGILRGSMFLDEVVIPAANLIGEEGAGFVQVMQGFDYTRALIGLMCVGAAQKTLEETVEYVKERKAFGKPLSTNQGVSFPMADWASKLEMVRCLCHRTLWLRDQGLPHTKEAAMCKLQGPDLSAEAIQGCLILHGQYGYTKDFPVEQRLRDVIGQQIADGPPNVQKIIISRAMFGREFA